MAASLRVGIPAHGERAWLPRTLTALAAQDDRDFEVVVCVNQPASWFGDPTRAELTADNRATLDDLAVLTPQLPYPLEVIAAIEPPHAPPDHLAGAGWARAQCFADLDPHTTPLCVSLDADTWVPPHYLSAVRAAFTRHPQAVALAAPYRHPLPDEPVAALRLLRYELYMRHYQLNLALAGSPYAFTALGSAIAFRAAAYRAVGGFPLRQAGEDFYLLQHLCKRGPLLRHLDATVEPAARPSTRVPFGTGPVIAALDPEAQRERYPFYPRQAFVLLANAIARFPELYRRDLTLGIEPWLPSAVRGSGAFAKMRRTLPSEGHFVRACHDRLDGLRTLQFLRNYSAAHPGEDSARLDELLQALGEPPRGLSFTTAAIPELDRLRDDLIRYQHLH